MEKKKATWIWYPADFEIWLGNRFNNRRTERGAMFPPFWKQDSHWVTVEFSKKVVLEHPETIEIAAEGSYNFMLDGKLQYGMPKSFCIPTGEHRINIKVWNQSSPPALYIKGETICSDSSWLATYEDKIWIDENGVAHGSGIYVPAATWNFNEADTPPSRFQLECEPMQPITATAHGAGMLYDFGKETFGYPVVQGLKGEGTLCLYYGESAEEALDKDYCETLDRLQVCEGEVPQPLSSKAFRYVYIEKEGGVDYESLSMLYEYAPHDLSRSGSFRCSDEELNRIWEVSAYTMDLTTREFFMDGIKRDRWTWSGDAIQSYLMNYYLRFDTECVKRTIRQLRGKDPVTAHVNTIMDYTFYWFRSILDYYQYTGDVDFVREVYPRMITLMNYCMERTNIDGFMEGQEDDWIFVDWVDFPMHKRGTLSFEQILFVGALQAMAVCDRLVGGDNDDYYAMVADRTAQKVKETFWSNEHHAYLHALEDGEMNPQITKFPNMFAILYGIASDEERQEIMDHVMLNDDIPAITTPYMRFYELAALCEMGLQSTVLPEMKAYWGGMLREGATTFWEKYIPEESGAQHLSMYGRPYGKSLCHAWGASPIYIIGKYFLGVQPTKPGYEEYIVKPALGGLQWMEGEVPTPFGKIRVKMTSESITVHSDGGRGTLVFNGQKWPIPAGKAVVFNLHSSQTEK
ncbi:MAG: alpha-rhamnosidase [Prevotella sp.]|nr:alpha-rhamnosidase [Prevotella sp.]